MVGVLPASKTLVIAAATTALTFQNIVQWHLLRNTAQRILLFWSWMLTCSSLSAGDGLDV